MGAVPIGRFSTNRRSFPSEDDRFSSISTTQPSIVAMLDVPMFGFTSGGARLIYIRAG